MGLKKLVIELTSLCNLNCEYCFKEAGASHIDPDLVKRVLRQARSWGASRVTYTGGEPALYPWLDQTLVETGALGYRFAVVTNGWHFSRIVPLLKTTRDALNHVFFSVDSATQVAHDQIRGAGSFERIMNAVDLCRTEALPFSFLAVVNRKNFHEMEQLSVMAERLGAVGIRFGHLLPTSEVLDRQLSLSADERRMAERQAQKLDSTLNIAVSFSATASNDTPGPVCEAFAGQTVSVDCKGCLSLCCQLADYRGATDGNDIVANLSTIDFAHAYAKFLSLAVTQRTRRDKALAMGIALAEQPCDFCARTMDKTAWRNEYSLVT
jgi:sulfatase maturation enzyme AslB (radical SAM superfamily)